MKAGKLNITVAALLLLLVSAVALAQTQAAMNSAACAEAAQADTELNTVYQQILRERQADALLIRKLRTAQRAWLTYRNAHLEALYPSPNARREYGSAYPACRCTALEAATRLRTEELRRWMGNGAAEEGDVCAGSTRRARAEATVSPGVGQYERADSIFRKRWTLVGMEGRSFVTDAPYLEFNVKQGRFSGSTGCNRISGGYRVGFGPGGDDLGLTPTATTKRACAGAAARQVETNFLRALEATRRFQVEGDVVRLYATNNRPLLTFRVEAMETSNVSPMTASVKGTVTYRQRIALAPNATIEVKLLDVSRADAPSVTIAEQVIKPAGRQVPIAFELRYDPRRIDERHRYALRVRILEGVKLRFTNIQAYPVLTGGHPDTIEVIVNPVS